MTLPTPLFLATDARAYEHFMARWSRRLAGPFLDFAGIKGGIRVLDVGCGTGVITAALAERGCTVVGLDASEPYLEGARHVRSHPNIVYELGPPARHIYALTSDAHICRPPGDPQSSTLTHITALRNGGLGER